MKQGFIPIIGRPYVTGIYSGALGGGALIAGETNGMGIDFTYATAASQMRVTTASVAVDSNPSTTLTYTSPSLKLCRQSDGVYRYGNHNLITQSQTLGTTWGASGASVTTDAAVAPDGTTTADLITENSANSAHYLSEAAPSVTGIYRYSIYLKPNGRDWIKVETNAAGLFINVTTEAVGSGNGTATITNVGNGWKRVVYTTIEHSPGAIYISLASANSLSSYQGDGASGMYAWGVELKRLPVQEPAGLAGYIATTTVARFTLPYEWDASGNPLGILIEEQRTNLSVNSQAIASWSGNQNNSGISSNFVTAPDGTTTADMITADGTANEHYLNNTCTWTAAAHTMSCFLKKGTVNFGWLRAYDGTNSFGTKFNLNTGVFDANFSGGAPTSSAIVDAGNGWYRCSITFTPAASSGTFHTQVGVGATTGSTFSEATAGTLNIWGLQSELGAFPTSPIHTTSATVTRAADDIKLLTSAFPFSATASTLVAAASIVRPPAAAAIYKVMLAVTDAGVGNHRLELYMPPSNANASYIILSGGSTVAQSEALGTVSANTAFKAAMAAASNDAAAVLNGGTVATDATVTMPAPNTLGIGRAHDTTEVWNGYIRQITYLPRRATNTELQTRTAP